MFNFNSYFLLYASRLCVCDAELIRWVFCAAFTDSNYKRSMQIDQVYRAFDHQTTQRDTWWSAGTSRGKEKTWTVFPDHLHKLKQ